jgi:hypothetical protein
VTDTGEKITVGDRREKENKRLDKRSMRRAIVIGVIIVGFLYFLLIGRQF